MGSPKPQPGILEIQPYIPGASKATGAEKTYKLSSNESALGASPYAVKAYAASANALHLYPDGAATTLRDTIAKTYDLDASRIVCGSGSDEILQLLTKAYVGVGDNIIQTEHGFLVYAIAAQACGGETRFAKETNLTTDIDTILALVDNRTRVVFVANPNNPTGTYIPGTELRRLRDMLRDDIILVIDAAYAEYMEEDDYEAGAALVDAHDNVVMTRTFSKIHGLGGLRLGWGYCPTDIADVLNRIRGPFNVNAAALAAGVAALKDTDFTARNRVHNENERAWLSTQLEKLGLDFIPSFANFILVNIPGDQEHNVQTTLSFLKSNGVIVRELDAYGLGDYLRISIGSKEANRRLVELLIERFGHD